MKYRMSLLLDKQEIEIPVLPERLEVGSPGQNETVTVLGLGEINILRKKGLREVAFESFLPIYDAPYVTGKVTKPIEIIKALQAHRDEKKPIRLLLYGSDLDINVNMGIEDLRYEERAGEVGDIYYSIKLKEWKPYSALKLMLPNGKDKVVISSAKRSGRPPAVKTHTVVKGDSMWSICKKRYGDGSKYPQLYAKNKAMIDKRNKGTGLPKYTIYAGQVLQL
ncbi:LysM peptidoglycan-binding domain-containing protein [Paenibacillus popilliae]|uniref:LysM domain-containing protein n=1 Tax=Paenibacillus popilliae ATCC 14706 TaxID=1212764 RepID=M9M3S6_PAEPP|nr:LysM peptidoglycan-binding domain-containing protein [Paenibacillus popilliae]GAC41908.1 uncharacterized protein PPOP_1265 [Paenibacillus popilliae ATCC 14706]